MSPAHVGLFFRSDRATFTLTQLVVGVEVASPLLRRNTFGDPATSEASQSMRHRSFLWRLRDVRDPKLIDA